MNIGKIGLFTTTNGLTSAESVALARRAEGLGYGALWLPEPPTGRNTMVQAAVLLQATSTAAVGTAVAVTYARDASAAVGAQMGLAELSGGRFVLGLGVSHAPSVEGVRKLEYSNRPLAAMRAYIEMMRALPYTAPKPKEAPPLLLAALGPGMTALARDMADGVLAFNSVPSWTAEQRRILGPGKVLAVEQKVVPATSAAEAIAMGRKQLERYMGLPNYLNNFRRMGYGDADFAAGGSDKLLGDLFAFGERAKLQACIDAHFAAGADHVYLHLQNPADRKGAPDAGLLELLAPR
jgi:probable F420-dependent oxidoreductase